MSSGFSLHSDVIGFRDLIEKIDELESMRRPWSAGWNMPGYMPDNGPAFFETCDEAREYIAESMREHAEQLAESDKEKADELEASAAELIRQTEEERDSDHGETVADLHYWITELRGADADATLEDEDDRDDLKFLREFEDCGASDWRHGVTFIADDYFEDYARQLAEDIGAIDPKAGWPLHCIDWKQASRELQMDYSSVEVDGVTYWFRD
jgi:hypothetical protein